MGFKIGMDRSEVVHELTSHYGTGYVLLGGCGEDGKTSQPDIPIASEEGNRMLSFKGQLCVFDQAKKLGVVLTIKGDKLSEVRVSWTNSEM